MKQILLPNERGYKANLHSHTVDSDGKLTAEQVKDYYKKMGYSIVGFTDHGFMCDRSSLCDDTFIALNGYENHLEPQWIKPNPRSNKCYHCCIYSPKADNVGMIGMTDYYYDWCCTYKAKELRPNNELVGGFFVGDNAGFGVHNLNRLIEQANGLGYLVVLNHPAWSHLEPQDYLGLKGLTALEIFNYGSYLCGFEEDNGTVYDYMLADGQYIGCTANDDNHNDDMADSFGGYNVMYPNEFTYNGVFDALKHGKMYASTGAEICGLYADGDVITVGSNNAQYVRFISDRNCYIYRKDNADLSTVSFTAHSDTKWFRIVVKDLNGKKAYSRAYFRTQNNMWE